jgi:hypothetical protein
MKLRSSAQRLAAFLLRLADGTDVRPARFVLPYEKRFLAAKIGCTQENLSRAFAALRSVGVDSLRGAVVISDVEALRTFARLPSGTPETKTETCMRRLPAGAQDHQVERLIAPMVYLPAPRLRNSGTRPRACR